VERCSGKIVRRKEIQGFQGCGADVAECSSPIPDIFPIRHSSLDSFGLSLSIFYDIPTQFSRILLLPT
jgi:hypothetical protein